MKARYVLTVLLIAILAVPASTAWARAPQGAASLIESAKEDKKSDDKSDDSKDDKSDQSSKPVPPDFLAGPAQTLSTFLTAMQSSPPDYARALGCLEFNGREANTAANRTRANRLAEYLRHLDYQTKDNPGVPDDPGKETTFSLLPPPANATPVTLYRAEELHKYSNGQATIALSLGAGGAWRFSKDTLADSNLRQLREADIKLIEANPSMRQSVASKSLEGWLLVNMPQSLQGQFLFIMYWQWIALAVLIFLGFLIDLIFRLIFGVLLRHWISKGVAKAAAAEEVDAKILRRAGRAMGIVVATIVWRAGISFLYLPISVFDILSVAADVLVVLAAIYAGFRLADLLGEVCGHRASHSESKLDDLLVPLIRKTLKFLILIIGVVYFAEAVDIRISPLLAGIGIGGLGFAFAAQNSIENFFGSVTVLLDRPFQVGDWVVIDTVEGTVETVGMRSTRVRTFYDSLVTLPNSILVKTKVNNYGQRSYRRWSTKIGLLYETRPEQVEAFCEGLRELVRMHPYMRRENYQVYLNDFGDSGIEILVYVFWSTPDWSTELRERHRYMLDMMRLAEALGVSFAYPTQTVYLARSPGTPESPSSLSAIQDQAANEHRGREAARSIVEKAKWRQEKPDPYRYMSEKDSASLDAGQDQPPSDAPPTETRGSAGGE
jgi:MscS family membrane protein